MEVSRWWREGRLTVEQRKLRRGGEGRDIGMESRRRVFEFGRIGKGFWTWSGWSGNL